MSSVFTKQTLKFGEREGFHVVLTLGRKLLTSHQAAAADLNPTENARKGKALLLWTDEGRPKEEAEAEFQLFFQTVTENLKMEVQ